MLVNTESIAHVDSRAKPTLVYLASGEEERTGRRGEVEEGRRGRRREKRSKTRDEVEEERRGGRTAL